ncbi:protein-tyrosine kinase 6b [Salarias fasciatus]|uniref:Tyrosine-protein kinase n=1 Tax=Salarias fasciatus TaxID=181472 RepID=A0A672HRY7_SALFA|nr:protein-tyrosine kinase 6-like [Salarias fasciatus]
MSRPGARAGSSPEDRLRRACPCLGALWDRIFQEKSDPPAPPGPVYTAMWSFEAGHPDELSFRRGDLFLVLNSSGDWWDAHKIERNGRVLAAGIVPSNYLTQADSLSEQPWYFGTMNRFDAQGHLMGPENQDGSFLVRHSERDGVGYVLSVRSSNRVKHYKIVQSNESSFHIAASLPFPTLQALVEHYQSAVLQNAGRLGSACKRRQPGRSDLSHSTVDHWTLPKGEFSLGEQLGSGYFADVYRGRWKNLINVAVKILKSDSDVDFREFHREVNMLKTLHHRYLISLFAICTESTPYYIITELMEKGSLLSFLRGPEGRLQDVPALVDMSVQVSEAMAYLEERRSIHRDLAARNVLVGADYICKVADFGLARIIKEPVYVTTEKKIPYKWSAPEALSHGTFSSKSDVWSFGILLYEVFTYGGVPYPGLDNQEVFEQVKTGYRMPKPTDCPDFIYHLMTECWQQEPEDRPDFRTLQRRLNSSTYEFK